MPRNVFGIAERSPLDERAVDGRNEAGIEPTEPPSGCDVFRIKCSKLFTCGTEQARYSFVAEGAEGKSQDNDN